MQVFRPKVDPTGELETIAGTYRIISGTGAYRGASGSGTIDYVVDMNMQDDASPRWVFHSKPA